jgi:hypothetical protein
LLLERGLLRAAERSSLEAKGMLEQVIAGYKRTRTHIADQSAALAALAETELALGEYRLAGGHAAQASSIAGSFAVPDEPSYWVGYGLLAQAEVEQALHNAAAARAFSTKALVQLTPTVGSNHPLSRKADEIAKSLL